MRRRRWWISEQLAELQHGCRLVEAEGVLPGGFLAAMCGRLVRAWREARGLPVDPLQCLRTQGYVETIEGERGAANAGAGGSYA